MRIKKLFASVLASAMVLGCMVVPSSAATGDTTDANWNGMLAIMGFNGSWGGWSYVSTDWGSGEWTITATVQDLMDVNGITDVDDFGGFSFQIWSISDDDDIDFALYIDDSLYDEGTYSDGTQVMNIYGLGYGDVTIDDPDTTISVEITVNSYTGTALYEIDDTIVDSYSSYTITLESSDGLTGEVTGNTYYVDDETGTYYIAVDVSDIPGDVTVAITDIQFE